jgi:hypothetical protein
VPLLPSRGRQSWSFVEVDNEDDEDEDRHPPRRREQRLQRARQLAVCEQKPSELDADYNDDVLLCLSQGRLSLPAANNYNNDDGRRRT